MKIVSIGLAVCHFMLPAAALADAFWDGGGGASLWSEAANWSDDTLPSSGNGWIGNGQTRKMPEVNAGTASVQSTLYVGHNRYAWAGPGGLTVSGGTLQVGGQGLAIGVDFRNGAVTQTGGQITLANEMALGHETNFGSYRISGGALDAGAHLLLSDAGTSSGLFEVNGSGATGITASYQLRFRNGTGELKYVLDAGGVTPIAAARLILGTGAGRILTVDARAYTGPEADIVLVDYSATGYWDGNPFSSVNLSANATNVSFGGVLSNKLTVHVVPVPGYTAWAGLNNATGGPAGDPDHDGLPNAIEYIMGSSPTSEVIEAGRLLTPSSGDVDGTDYLFCTFTRKLSSKTSDTAVHIQVGDSPDHWTESYAVGNDAVSAVPEVTFSNAGPGLETVTLKIAKGDASRKFARLQVTVATPYHPASFAMFPYAAGASAIHMMATTGADFGGPVEYYFAEISGNPGGTDSGWQTSPSYTDTGLNPSTQYTYTVTMRDHLGNTGTASLAISATTEAGGAIARVWNQRVDPKTHPGALARKIMPVTWEDQGGLVLLPVATGLNLTADYNGVNMPAYRGYLDYWTSGPLNSTNAPFGFESQLYSPSFFSFTTNYDQVVDEWVNRDSYIAGCYGPGGWTYDGFFSLPNPDFPGGIPDAVHSYTITRLGGRFGGWEYGENDAGYCYSPMPEEPPTREMGHDLLLGFNHRWSEKLHNYMVAMQNTTWGPYMADTSYFRKIGVQTPNQMYNINMWAGLLRGASRQHGVLWWPNIDSYWGLNGGQRNWGVPGGDKTGNSVSLIRRATYMYFMYGAAAIQPAAPHHIPANVAGTSTDILSPFGEIAVEIRNFMRAHPYPALGTPHLPVALVWDYYAGWLPPRTGSGLPYMVWGKSSYEKGDHQIDMLFRSLFPHYEDAAYFLDERGFLTETPCGDIFDVLLSNTPRYVLNQYDVAVVIGRTKIEGQLQTTLQDFINRGGSVVTTAAQLTSGSAGMFGVQLAGSTSIETVVNWTAGGSVTESNFKLHHLNCLPGASVVAQTPAGDPVVVKYRTAAGGELLVFAADYGLSEWSGSVTDAGANQPLFSPYQMLNHVQAYLGPWLKKWNLIDVAGPPIQYLTSVTQDTNRVIVTLCNNVETNWSGSISLIGASIASCEDLITGQSFGSGTSVPVSVGGDSLVILEVSSATPVVEPKSATPTPAPTAQELALKGDQAFEKWDKFTPQGMLAMIRPAALGPAQGGEPSGALYVNSWLYDGLDPDTWLPAVKSLGLDGVEIRAAQLYRDDMAALWSKLGSHGLRVGAVHAGADMPPFSFGSIASDLHSDREPTLQWLELTMELMQDAGIKRLILYPGYKVYGSGSPYTSSQTLASLSRLKTKAQSCGVTIMVETAYGQETYLQTANLQGLISSVDSPWVKVGMNTANTWLAEGSFSTPLANTLDYVHLSSFKPLTNGWKRSNYAPLTDGEIPVGTLNGILADRRSTGRATCIYMLSPDNPLGALADFLNRK
ncbi:MAG: sugar phosphate isomerase/epimerase [Verrucomicrobia bacterium]|nr:sugar phosphate isomerase/epimerase [Verrucomicrobiota bacterium]